MGRWDQYIRHEREEVEQREAAIRARKQVARAAAEKMAAELGQRFRVTRVWLFGSLRSGQFSLHSDIDLAVLGLDPRQYFTAWSALSGSSDFQVDLVCLETASESLRQMVLSEGVILYDGEGGTAR